jgi:putative oxidoreductase
MRKDVGLLLMRTAVGGTLLAHGTQKLFGWFGGGGLASTAAHFEQGGFRPGRHHALAAALSETGGGALLVAGLATPAAGAAVAGTMAVAADMHRPAGFFATQGGYEYPLILGAAGAGLALTGAGRLSLDALAGDRLARPWMALVGLGGAVVASRLLTRRRRAQLATPAPSSEHEHASVSGEATAAFTASDEQHVLAE